MNVVQNRLYSKRGKLELGLTGGNIIGDPFLNTYTLGGFTSYHFTEYLGLDVLGWGALNSASSALTTLQGPPTNTTANTNEPRWFVGAGPRASVLYGKLSLLGLAILYFDAYFTAGAGAIGTESGSSLAVFGGIGQQIHFAKRFSLNLDFRLMRYDETILRKTSPVGQNLGSRTNISGAVTLGVSVLLF